MFDAMNSPNRNLAIVRAVRDQGGTPTSVAKRFGISRQRVHQTRLVVPVSVAILARKEEASGARPLSIHRCRDVRTTTCGEVIRRGRAF